MKVYFSRKLWNKNKSRFEAGFLLVDGERISNFVFGSKNPTRSKAIDFGDLLLAPSAIDLHVHCRDFEEAHKETFESCEWAAFKGGLSTVVAMANSRPRLDDSKMLAAFREKVKKRKLRFLTFAAVTRNLEGSDATDWEKLLKDPLVAGLSDDGRPIASAVMMEKALIATKKAKKIISLHEEDLSLSRKSQLHLSEVSMRAGLEGSPAESEFTMVERDIALATKLKAALHLGHISSRRSVAAIAKAKRAGLSVSAELTPHHGLLNTTAFDCLQDDQKSLFKVCPVIRSEDDRLSLLEAARTGILDCFASDHAPHSRFEKEAPYEACMHGIVALENYYPLYIRVKSEAEISWKTFFNACVFRPAQLLGSVLKDQPWEKGSSADFVVINDKKEEKMIFNRSLSQNSPLAGLHVKSTVQTHFLKGRKVYEI